MIPAALLAIRSFSSHVVEELMGVSLPCYYLAMSFSDADFYCRGSSHRFADLWLRWRCDYTPARPEERRHYLPQPTRRQAQLCNLQRRREPGFHHRLEFTLEKYQIQGIEAGASDEAQMRRSLCSIGCIAWTLSFLGMNGPWYFMYIYMILSDRLRDDGC